MFREQVMRVVVMLILVLAQRAAAGSDVEVCASASEDGQRLLTAHQLVAARQRLLACTRPQCPTPIKKDCDALLSQVDAALPTIVIAVKDARRRDVTDASVSIDDRSISDALSGTPVSVDPGRHVVRASRATGAQVEVVVVVREGEKRREVLATFADEAELPASGSPAPPVRGRRRTSITTFALGGVSVALLGTFAYLAITGQRDVDRCASDGCIRSETDAIARKRIYAWISGGIGIAAASTAIYLYATSTADGKPAIAIAGSF